MYLKEIKASGFKSFADKINLTFNDDITCIVGPNGSGKSNIVDAVKWVLGEQSVKTLRGDGAMTDVIFSGSKSRKPLNLASVTLVFDNSDSYLKVPYSEISVTRKVYRSGENEYFINNEKCRLKDINDLFLDSGIGKYAFNIISQGEVANIINSSPYERRALFEEAAGVLKYKKRKEEALRKLNKTNENMVRIKDIISELDTQIEPLRIQKDTALRYLDYEEKLRDVEIALIASDLEKLNIDYNDNKKRIEKLEEDIAFEMSSSSHSDASVEEIKGKINLINQKIVSENNEFINVTREIERLNGEVNILKERSKYESDDIKVHENLSRLNEEKYIVNNKIISFKGDIDVINNKISSNDNDLNKFKTLLNSKILEKNDIEKNISVHNKNLIDIEYKIKYLTDYIEQGSSINSNVRKILSNATLKGIHNIISNLIECDDSYSLALSVSLGSARDYVVVDNPSCAKSAINYLKENNLGRVTFFPLDVIKERFIDEEVLSMLKHENGYIGVFSDLVIYDEKYANIIKNVLGNVILMDNIDNANRVSKIINNKYKIVTLTGEVINVGGSITGGKVKINSVISEKYELNNFIHKKEVLLSELDNLNDKFNFINDEIDTIKNNLFEFEKGSVLLNEELNSKVSSLDKLSNELISIEKELNSLDGLVNNTLKEEEERVTKLYYEMISKKEQLERESKITLGEKDKLTSILEELEANYRVSNAKLRTLENELKDLEIVNSKASVRMDNLLNTLSESYQMTFEKARANYILEIDEDVARRNVNEYKRELKNIGPVNVGAIEEFDRVNTRYEFLKKQSTDLEEAAVTLLKIIDELDDVMKDDFYAAFKQIEIEFDKVFKELFKGGSATLKLTD